jgi:hypothetical protein
VEHRFGIRDVVYLRVQPLRPSPWRRGGNERMRPHLFGPSRVIQRVGDVAYELELTIGSQGHSIYHASCFQSAWEPQVTTEREPLELVDSISQECLMWLHEENDYSLHIPKI